MINGRPQLNAQVDLNRNFPLGFGLGADAQPCSEVYKGQYKMECKRTGELMAKTFSDLAKTHQKQPNLDLRTHWEEDSHGMEEAISTSTCLQSPQLPVGI